MALINCPECGRKISDKADSCPGCGCPSSDFIIKKQSEPEELVSELHTQYPNDRVKAIKILREKRGYDLKTAKDLIDKEYLGLTQSEKDAIAKKEWKKSKQELSDSFNNFCNVFNKDKTVHCPKCGSTSISYDTKKLSVGRGVVGYGLAGAPGAVLGGLSSKKGYAVCLNCGKQWKL